MGHIPMRSLPVSKCMPYYHDNVMHKYAIQAELVLMAEGFRAMHCEATTTKWEGVNSEMRKPKIE